MAFEEIVEAYPYLEAEIELQARLIGELRETGPTVSALIAPEWHESV